MAFYFSCSFFFFFWDQVFQKNSSQIFILIEHLMHSLFWEKMRRKKEGENEENLPLFSLQQKNQPSSLDTTQKQTIGFTNLNPSSSKTIHHYSKILAKKKARKLLNAQYKNDLQVTTLNLLHTRSSTRNSSRVKTQSLRTKLKSLEIDYILILDLALLKWESKGIFILYLINVQRT